MRILGLEIPSWAEKAETGYKNAIPIHGENPQGPWTGAYSNYIARQVAPQLYEAMRESIPVIDAAINRLVNLDGIVRVEGDNEALVSEINDWMDAVRVNDVQTGFQAFYELQSNEAYEQGCGIGQWLIDGNDITELRVGDSKGLFFKRENGELQYWYRAPSANRKVGGKSDIESILRNSLSTASAISANPGEHGFVQLDPDTLVYAGYNVEANSPYGTSLMRSIEFVSKILLTIDNAQLAAWERFGDPSFDVIYKTKQRDADKLQARQKAIADNLEKVISLKQSGKSADFVNAIHADDELSIKILGGKGEVLEIEAPARHILEQIVSKTGLPSWMLGFHWSTAERLAQRQSEIVLQESRTRFAKRRPGLEKIIKTMLRVRGRTWKDGDWRLVQELPNLQDLEAKARARFMDAQADMLEGGQQITAVDPGQGRNDDDEGKLLSLHPELKHTPARAMIGVIGHKMEAFPEDETYLESLEIQIETDLAKHWAEFIDAVVSVFVPRLPEKASKADSDEFVFHSFSMLPLLRVEADKWIASVTAADQPLVRNMVRAWLRGLENAEAEIVGELEIILEVDRQVQADRLAQLAIERIEKSTGYVVDNDLIRALNEGVYDGMSSKKLAKLIKERLGHHAYRWDGIARSVISESYAQGKMSEYAAMDLEQYDWRPAGGACEICRGHEANNPHLVGVGPMPGTDSHPNCRCTVSAVV